MILLPIIVRKSRKIGAFTVDEPQITVPRAENVDKDTIQEAHIPALLDAMLDMRFPGDVSIAPDGKRVAFVVREMAAGEQKHRAHIWMVDTIGGQPYPFITGKQEEYSPRWSPDGQHLAFIALDEGSKEKPQVHLMAADGGE